MDVVIVVPCYNEAGRWNSDYWRTMISLPGIRWVFVDDGSSDNTAAVLEATTAMGAASVLRLAVNGGKAEAVRRGVLAALDDPQQPSAVGYMDADGAFDPGDVVSLCETYCRYVEGGDYDAVWSARVALSGRDIRRSSARHYIGRAIATFVSLGQREIPYDTQSGFKLFEPSGRLSACLQSPFKTRWLFELEMLNRWQRLNGSPLAVWEEPLHHWRDVPGSKLNPRSVGPVVKELLEVKAQQMRARRRPR